VLASRTTGKTCVNGCAVRFGAEMDVLEGIGGDIGVNGSSEVDGDGDDVEERSPARATSSGSAARK
jgi:hypothetical protein